MSAPLRFVALSLATSASLCLGGCCCCGRDSGPSSCGPSLDMGWLEQGPALDLGIALHPPDTPPEGAVRYDWVAQPLEPARYQVGYGLGQSEALSLEQTYQAYARSVHYRSKGKEAFSWRPPAQCQDDLHCVFEHLAARNRADIVPLALRFTERARQAGLSSLELAQLIIAFVQAIPYEIPQEEPFGVLPPALVLSQRRGDCDSKALLGMLLLHEQGIDSVLISSEAHRHAMLGVALPTSGKSFSYNGRRYAFAECTAKGSPLGHINPELMHPDDWKVVPIRLK